MEIPPLIEEAHHPLQWHQFADRLIMQTAQAVMEGWSHEAHNDIALNTLDMANDFIAAGWIDNYAALQRYFQQHGSRVQLVAVAPQEWLPEIAGVFVRDVATAQERPYWLGVHLDDGVMRQTTPIFQQLLANHEENIRRLSGHTGLLGVTSDAPCTSHTQQQSCAKRN